MFRLLCAYSFFLPFTFAFALTPIVTIPVVLSMMLFMTCVPRLGYIVYEDIIIPICIVLLSICSFVINAENLEVSKSINHIAAITYVFLCLYPCLVIAFRSIAGNRRKQEILCVWIGAGITVSSGIAIWQCMAINVLHIPLPNVPSLIVAEPYGPLVTVSGVLLTRARSVAWESGEFAMYLMVVVPVYLVFWRESHRITYGKYLVVTAAIVGLLATFSVSGVFATLGCLLVYVHMVVLKGGVKKQQTILLTIFVALIVIGAAAGPVLYSIIDNKINSVSYLSRAGRMEGNILLWSRGGAAQLLFGLGPGYYAGYGIVSVVGFYVLVLVQWGFGGVVVFGCFMYKHFALVMRRSDHQALLLSLSLTSMLVFLGALSNYYYPWVAFCLAVVRANSAPWEGIR